MHAQVELARHEVEAFAGRSADALQLARAEDVIDSELGVTALDRFLRRARAAEVDGVQLAMGPRVEQVAEVARAREGDAQDAGAAQAIKVAGGRVLGLAIPGFADE